MSFFGLDIGSQNIKIAQIERGGNRPKLVAFGSVPTPPRALLSESESDLLALAEAIKKLYNDTGISTKNVVAALPEDRVLSKVVTFPKLSENELGSAIKWEAEQYIPVPLDEVNLDYQIVGESKKDSVDQLEILLMAAPKLLIEKIVKVIKVAGLVPVSLEPEILALARSLTVDSESCLLVDLGARATDLAIVKNQNVIFTYSIPTAGEALTRAVASDLNIDLSQAEEYKKTYGASRDLLEGKIREAIKPVLGAIIREIEKAIRFHNESGKEKIKRVVLAGGTAGLPEIVTIFAQNLNLEIQIGDPFSMLEKSEEMMAKIPADSMPFYATSIGLALKEID